MKPLRIAIDISELFSKVPGGGGQGTAIRSLVAGLARVDSFNLYTLFSIRRMIGAATLLGELPKNFRLVHIPVFDPRMIVLGWQVLRWPACESLIGEHDVIHATSPALVPSCRRAKLILTVHDLVWWRFPQGLRPWGRALLRRGIHVGAREAAVLTTDSEATRRDLLSYLQGRVAPAKVRTIHNGINLPREVSRGQVFDDAVQRYGIHEPYIVCLGTIEPRKNLHRLLEAYAMLTDELRAKFQLVVIGPHGWKMPAMQTLIASLGLEREVLWTGYIPDNDRDALLRGATVLVYPSMYEGFGLPILEAMACGVPVITSDRSSMPEVAGEAALLVDPTNARALTAAIERLLLNEELRRELIARGFLRLGEFSCERMASHFLATYRMATA